MSSPTPTGSEESSPGATQRTLAVIALGVGVVGVGLGAGFGLASSSKWSEAKKGCAPSGCDPASVEAGRDAGALADVSTASFIAGGVALAGAAILWFTAPRAAVPVVTISSNGAGVAARF
jgi:hypothetical protein